jgi:hypothetical protein
MSLLSRAWITAGRVRRRIGKPPLGETGPRRKRWINQHAPGRSFVDVGGLFQIDGEIALQAAEAGASAVTLFDGGDVEFTDFPRKAAERGIDDIRFVQGDLEDPVAVDEIGQHDIVYCAGVIYHTPNPVRQLLHLRQITRELLYLGTATVPEIPGVPQACVYYPYLPESVRRTVASAHWNAEPMFGIGVPFDDRPMHGHGNFWWGITPSALRAMLATARFEVIEEFRDRESPFRTEVVARPIDKPPLLPPLSYFRHRREARNQGLEPPAFDDFYDEQPAFWF